ncbi:unnamed protein product [Rotaria sp. Silwood1]|nr:unnamed protein product [Rotaria sp. Silwood1]CAF3803163.1 unnamed protein product [Rotaria sp. Silwood1]CAF3814413.1 unnamed protein product [Rotaria sp. Silwood1]CAF4786192.1 unnamed protein product [Rotaria sp. Silwood1]CAF4875682.1 unnamed protein product [Rotaria sp. Silwood1]
MPSATSKRIHDENDWICIGSTSNIRNINGEIDSTVSFQCVIDALPFNTVITWVYRPKVHKINGIKWLPLYANARRLTQNTQRFIVDYSGYNEYTKKYSSILTIHQLKSSDEGIYMCKSNQYQSIPSLFNLTISPSMKILPKDGIIELNHIQRSINLSCTVRELSMHTIDPLRIKWYHNNHEIPNSHLIENLSLHTNQATLILDIHHLSLNDSGLFKCVYDNGKASKDVRIFYTSSGK